MGGAYTSTAQAKGTTEVKIQETRDARVMAKFAGAYAEEEERQLVVLYVRLGLAATLVSTSDQPPQNH